MSPLRLELASCSVHGASSYARLAGGLEGVLRAARLDVLAASRLRRRVDQAAALRAIAEALAAISDEAQRPE